MNELIMLVGLPASGKSTWAKEYSETHPDYIVHSSFLYQISSIINNRMHFQIFQYSTMQFFKYFTVVCVIIIISIHFFSEFIRRVHFLKGVPKHVYKTCIMFLKTYEKCLKDNSKRENSVPDEVITRMRKVFSPPMYHEGFNEIRVVQDDHKDIKELIDMARDFDQENPHHSLTLYEHLKKVSEGVPREEKNLWVAACLHDIGKLFTKSRINGKGEEDDYCHYYQHHCVGAYECLTCFDFSGALTGKDIYDAFYTANLIYYHMHPYLSWSQSNKAKNKDKYLIGKQMFSDVMLLHEADVKGH